MRVLSWNRRSPGGVMAALGVSCHAGLALADPCPTDLPNPIYGAGDSAATATLGDVALAGQTAAPVTILYWDAGACTGYRALTEDVSTRPVPPYFKYWTTAGGTTPIQCEPSGDEDLSFAHMAQTPLLCPGNAPLAAGFGDFLAPVQTINFIVHVDSDYDGISAEALYHIYGFGPGGVDAGSVDRSVAPWTNPLGVFARKTDSFFHLIVANAIRVPVTSFKISASAPNNFLDGDTVSHVSAWATPNEALGYVSGPAADLGEDADQIKTLAYQHFDQSCGYLPDSAPGERDKANVRNGQYYLWTPAHFFAPVDGEGVPTNAQVVDLISWFDTSVVSPEGTNVIDAVINSGDIPLCAMRAIRSGDLEPIASYAPAAPCNGYFEHAATGATDYVACPNGDGDCDENAGEKCRWGFCEAY